MKGIHSHKRSVVQVLRFLPPPMAQELLHAMYKDLVMSMPMFRKLESEVIMALCTKMHPFKVGNSSA